MLKHGMKFTPTQPNVIAILEKVKKANSSSFRCVIMWC